MIFLQWTMRYSKFQKKKKNYEIFQVKMDNIVIQISYYTRRAQAAKAMPFRKGKFRKKSSTIVHNLQQHHFVRARTPRFHQMNQKETQ